MSYSEPLSPFDLADSYGAAEKLIDRAQRERLDVIPVWDKLYRVRKYLRQQATAELSEVLS